MGAGNRDVYEERMKKARCKSGKVEVVKKAELPSRPLRLAFYR